MSKKRSLSALGAALLTGITLATMVAPAANAAQPTKAPTAQAQTYGKFLMTANSGDNGRHVAIVDSRIGYTYAKPFIKAEAAEAAAINVSVPRAGEWDPIQAEGTDNCLTKTTGFGVDYLVWALCDADNSLQYFTLRDGELVNFGLQTNNRLIGTTNSNANANLMMGGGRGVQLGGAFAQEKFTGEGVFSAQNLERATIRGQGTAGASITVKNSAGATVASTVTDPSGKYSVAITAPNKGGVYSLNVTQNVDGAESVPVKVDLDYGNAVAVTTPADGADHAAGEVAMSGSGTPGASISVFDNAGRNPVGMATVNASGAWSLNTSSLNEAEHKLEVKQLSKGNNTTTASVTLNPGGSVNPPVPGIGFEVTTPANNSTVRTSDKQVTFTGRGNPGSKVSVMNGARNIGTVESVPASGDWSFTATMNYAEYDLTAYYKKVATGPVTSQQPLHITVTDDAAARPFVISTPANNSTVETADKSVTFSGTGMAGGKVTIMNSSRTIGTTDVDSNGAWSFTATMNYADYNLTAYYKKVPTGPVTTQQQLNISVTAGALGFTIGSPAAGSTVNAGVITFTGTGKANSKVSIFLNSSSRGTATTNADGTWTIPVTINTPGSYEFTIYYKANPTDAAAPSVKHAVTVR